MVSFPFDSQLEYDPETGEPIYDRAVSSQPLRKLLRDLFTTGVMPNPSTCFQVTAGLDGMTVIVKAGYAVVDGGLCQEVEDRTLEVTASDNYDRIDTVVLRWNENVDVRTADLYVKKGVPAASPVRPELQRGQSIYEIGLADVFVTRNVATITADKITDTRYESSRCGIVSSVSEWDTTTIYQQIQADLAYFKENSEADFNTWFTNTTTEAEDDIADFEEAQQAAFDLWFQDIMGHLSQDAATDLQNQINDMAYYYVQDHVLYLPNTSCSVSDGVLTIGTPSNS